VTDTTPDLDQHLDGLTELQRRFVEEMLLDPTSATRAYIKAGGKGTEGSSARQQAARLMADGGVARALDAARRERSARMRIDADWVTERLVMLINRCMTIEEVYDSQGERTGVFRFDAGGANVALRTLVLHLEKNPPKRNDPADAEAAMERLRMMGIDLDKRRCLPDA
jgi:phage terminase small subunit